LAGTLFQFFELAAGVMLLVMVAILLSSIANSNVSAGPIVAAVLLFIVFVLGAALMMFIKSSVCSTIL